MTSLTEISAKVASGERLTAADADIIASTPDIVSVGMVASEVRRRLHGDEATFLRVASWPAASPPPAAEDAPVAAGELRLVGAPASVGQAIDAVRRLVDIARGRVPVAGFSLADLEALACRDGIRLVALLERLSGAGLELVAQAPVDRMDDPEASLEAAAQAGLPVATLTIEQADEAEYARLTHAARTLQEEFCDIRAFAPLPRRSSAARASTGYDDVRQVALARLLVDNIESLQVDWALCGAKLAQVALLFGADDVDAVSAAEEGGRRAPLEDVRRNIRAASLVPVERNGRFQTLRQ